MSQCVSTATATLFTTLLSTSTTSSASISTSTSPPETSTITSSECLATATDGACNSTSTVVETTTIPGLTTTVPVQVPFVITFTSTEATATLFSTSCSSSPVSPPPTSPASTSTPPSSAPPPSSPPPSSPPSSSNTTSSVLVASTPTSTIVSSLTSTFANGSVATLITTEYSTLPPTSVFVPTTLPVSSPTNTSNNTPTSDIAPIVGGAVGGFVGLLGLAVLVWVVWRRRSARWDDIFDQDPAPRQVERRRQRTLDFDAAVEEVEPKPYHYGLVGHPGSNPQVLGGSPPPSRPPSTTLDHGVTPPLNLQSNTGGPVPHLSLQGFPAYNISPNSTQPNTANASRPSTAGSMNPLVLSQMQQHQRTTSQGARSLSGDFGYFSAPPAGPARSQSATAVVPHQSPDRQERERRHSRMSPRPSSAEMDNIPLQPRSTPSTPTSALPGSSRGPLHLVNAEPSSPEGSTKVGGPPARPQKSRARPQSANQVVVHQDAGRVREPRAGPSQNGEDEPPAYST